MKLNMPLNLNPEDFFLWVDIKVCLFILYWWTWFFEPNPQVFEIPVDISHQVWTNISACQDSFGFLILPFHSSASPLSFKPWRWHRKNLGDKNIIMLEEDLDWIRWRSIFFIISFRYPVGSHHPLIIISKFIQLVINPLNGIIMRSISL